MATVQLPNLAENTELRLVADAICSQIDYLNSDIQTAKPVKKAQLEAARDAYWQTLAFIFASGKPEEPSSMWCALNVLNLRNMSAAKDYYSDWWANGRKMM